MKKLRKYKQKQRNEIELSQSIYSEKQWKDETSRSAYPRMKNLTIKLKSNVNILNEDQQERTKNATRVHAKSWNAECLKNNANESDKLKRNL